jgi:hypothetical protein
MTRSVFEQRRCRSLISTGSGTPVSSSGSDVRPKCRARSSTALGCRDRGRKKISPRVLAIGRKKCFPGQQVEALIRAGACQRCRRAIYHRRRGQKMIWDRSSANPANPPQKRHTVDRVVQPEEYLPCAPTSFAICVLPSTDAYIPAVSLQRPKASRAMFCADITKKVTKTSMPMVGSLVGRP